MNTPSHSIGETDSGSAPSEPQAAPRAAAAGSPPLLIGGESYTASDEATGEKCLVVPLEGFKRVRLVPLPDIAAHPYAAITDWLNFTFDTRWFDRSDDKCIRQLVEILGPMFMPVVEGKGKLHKYERLYRFGETSAMFRIGGNNGTAMVELPSSALTAIPDLPALGEQVRLRIPGARITRWDGAVDDYLGVHSVNWAAQLYLEGTFNTGGRDPKADQKGNWIKPDGTGRTFYVGDRKNGKLLRVYEKGMQFGALFHPWVRWEVELHNRSRIVPWEVLDKPGQFVAGQYPKALAWLSEEKTRIATIQKATSITYDAALFHARNQVGALVNFMETERGQTPREIVDALKRDAYPKRLRHPGIDNVGDIIE